MGVYWCAFSGGAEMKVVGTGDWKCTGCGRFDYCTSVQLGKRSKTLCSVCYRELLDLRWRKYGESELR